MGLLIHASAVVLPWYGFYGGTSRDRGLIIFGYTYSFGVGSADAMLIRTDSLGNHVWGKTFGGPNPNFGKYVRQVSGGGYVILGETFLSGNFDLFLARTDMNFQTHSPLVRVRRTCSSSKPTETETYGGTLDDSARAMVRQLGKPPMDKDIVVAGHTRSLRHMGAQTKIGLTRFMRRMITDT
ncbi:MAG: hypothetical protein ACO2OT_04545 [Candidatus Caldipriscus sp.]